MTETKRKKMSKDRKQYITTMVCSLLAIELIVGSTFLSFYFIARRDAVKIGESTVAEYSERLNSFLLKSMDILDVTGTNVEYMMEHGAGNEEIVHYLEYQSQDYSDEIEKGFTGIYGVFRGELLDGGGWKPIEGYDYHERPWYLEAMACGGEPTVVAPYLDAKTDSMKFSVARLLNDGESVISLDISMDGIQKFADNIKIKERGYGLIVANDGLVVAHADESSIGENYLTDGAYKGTQKKEIIEKVMAKPGKTLSFRIGGKDSRVFSKVVQEKLYVIMIVNVHVLFREVETNLIVCILLSYTVFALVAYFIHASYKNKEKATRYAKELEKYQHSLEEQVEMQTQEIRQQARKMEEIQSSAVEGMATLIEGRDGYTGEHVRNTKTYVSMILGFMYKNKMHPEIVTKSYIKKSVMAATLHDVGKIMISDAVLNKPGKFTPEEYDIMKQHAAFGGEIVKDILGDRADEELVRIASNVARYHHEKWNGKGYPEGLKGEEIPFCARVMAVADVFDALISKRVYKEAMSVNEAVEILNEDAGSHFDPEIVEVFVRLIPKVRVHLDSASE